MTIKRFDGTPGHANPTRITGPTHAPVHPSHNKHIPDRREGLRVRLSPIKGLSAKWMKKDFVFQNGPLDAFEVSMANESEKYKTIHNGEFSRRTGRSLIVTSFQTLAVLIPYPWVQDPNVGYDIDALTATLARICEDGHPFELLCTYHYNADPFLHLRAARLETLKVTSKAGEDDAHYYDVSFSEYRDPTAPVSGKRKRIGKAEWPKHVTLFKDGSYTWNLPAKAIATSTQGTITEGTVGSGPGLPAQKPLTLGYIAKIAYGQPTKWRKIAEANGITKWSANEPLIKYSKYRKKGGTILVPDPVKTERRHPVLGDTFVATLPGDDHGE